MRAGDHRQLRVPVALEGLWAGNGCHVQGCDAEPEAHAAHLDEYLVWSNLIFSLLKWL